MKFRRICFSLIILLCTNLCMYGEDHVRLSDIRSISTGGQGVTLSSYRNPSLLSDEESKHIYLQYFNKYGLSELSSLATCFIYPNNILHAGINISSFGYEKYRESMLRILLGKQLSSRWSAGLSVQYYFLQTDLFDERPACLSTDIGMSYSPVDNLLIGLLVINTPLIAISDESTDYKRNIGNTIEIGARWNIINSMLIMSKLSYVDGDSFTIGIGLEQNLYDSFFIRAGLQTKPFTPSFGLGYRHNLFAVDVAAISYPQLGYSTGIGLTVNF